MSRLKSLVTFDYEEVGITWCRLSTVRDHRVRWMKTSPDGSLLTGSFRPVDDDEAWDSGLYLDDADVSAHALCVEAFSSDISDDRHVTKGTAVEGRCPLEWAILAKRMSTVDKLLQMGFEITYRELMRACKVDFVQILERARPVVDSCIKYFDIFQTAVRYGALLCCQFLYAAKCRPSADKVQLWLDKSPFKHNDEFLHWVGSKFGVGVKAGDPALPTKFQTCVFASGISKRFHNKGIDDCDGNGVTLLHLAATRSVTELQAVLERRPRPTVCDIFGQTALHYAVYAQADLAVFRLLLDYGVPINCRDRYGFSALDLATQKLLHGYVFRCSIIAFLKSCGAEVVPNWIPLYRTPLPFAVPFAEPDGLQIPEHFNASHVFGVPPPCNNTSLTGMHELERIRLVQEIDVRTEKLNLLPTRSSDRSSAQSVLQHIAQFDEQALLARLQEVRSVSSQLRNATQATAVHDELSMICGMTGSFAAAEATQKIVIASGASEDAERELDAAVAHLRSLSGHSADITPSVERRDTAIQQLRTAAVNQSDSCHRLIEVYLERIAQLTRDRATLAEVTSPFADVSGSEMDPFTAYQKAVSALHERNEWMSTQVPADVRDLQRMEQLLNELETLSARVVDAAAGLRESRKLADTVIAAAKTVASSWSDMPAQTGLQSTLELNQFFQRASNRASSLLQDKQAIVQLQKELQAEKNTLAEALEKYGESQKKLALAKFDRSAKSADIIAQARRYEADVEALGERIVAMEKQLEQLASASFVEYCESAVDQSLKPSVSNLLEQRSLNDFSDRVAISRTANSVVYTAKLDGTPCVLKELFLGEEKTLKLFETEVQVLRRLRHPAIVPLLGQFVERTTRTAYLHLPRYAFTMNTVVSEGGQLAPNVANRLAKLQLIFAQLAQGLSYLNGCNVVHRDIKLENILLDEHLRPVLADFGISKDFSLLTTHVTLMAPGTFAYMAPELLGTKPAQASHESDIFALGVAFHLAVFGTFPTVLPEGVVLATATDDLSARLCELLRVMLSVKPEKRPTAAQVLRFDFFTHSMIQDLVQSGDLAMNHRGLAALQAFLRALKPTHRHRELPVRRSHLVQDVIQHFRSTATRSLRSELTVKYADEIGMDGGGLLSDLFSEFAAKVFADRAYFDCADGQGAYIPASQCTDLEGLKAIGRVFIKAALDNRSASLPLCPFVFSLFSPQLRTQRLSALTMRDLESYDPALAHQLKRLPLLPDLSRLELTLLSGEAVSPLNVTAYVREQIQEKLVTCRSAQLQALAECVQWEELGLAEHISALSLSEMTVFLCGFTVMNPQDVIELLKFEGFAAESQTPVHLREFIGNMSSNDLQKLLVFITARTSLPADRKLTLTISRCGDVARLPVAHTCSCSLDLPDYNNRERLQHKLTEALLGSGAGFLLA
eukprot:TRINITY_DN4666_c0_g1_i1.p1 TRINITY_DN4666_c0_g1~~TRINITY_DN4666_c0_g1_i1.p1  ORF type:complete len:1563 (+),score=355.26 TRINITY_DN4666_c0_g1_i1:458-4690(+)